MNLVVVLAFDGFVSSLRTLATSISEQRETLALRFKSNLKSLIPGHTDRAHLIIHQNYLIS